MYLTKYLISNPLDDHRTIMVNGLSGAVDILENHEMKTLGDIGAGKSIRRIDSPVFRQLVRRGYILNSEEDEVGIMKRLESNVKEYQNRQIKTFGICPTHSCNFRCTYCFENGVAKNNLTIFNSVSELFAGIIALEKVLKVKRRPILNLYGGEPLQLKTMPFVEDVLKLGVRRGHRFTVATNGFMLHEFIDLFSDYKKSINFIQVSLDGPRTVHDSRRILASGKGTFERITNNIQKAIYAGLKIHIRTTVDNTNLNYLPELGNYILEREWKNHEGFKAYLAAVEDSSCIGIPDITREDILIKQYLEMKENPKNAESLSVFDDTTLFVILAHLELAISGSKTLMLPNFRYCEATQGKNFLFGADGYIYQCFKSIGDKSAAVGKYSPQFCIFEKKIKKWMNRDILSIEKCRSCSAATFCGGGCAYGALRKHGDLNQPNCPDIHRIIMNYLNYRFSYMLKR